MKIRRRPKIISLSLQRLEIIELKRKSNPNLPFAFHANYMTTFLRTILTTGLILLFSISQRSTAFSNDHTIHIKGINDSSAFVNSEENYKGKLIFSHLLPPSVKTIVLDAGHGGKDRGCKGSMAREKDIALAITKKVGEYITAYHPDVNVIYTRKEDVFVTLNQRARIANKNKADLFISIHCNYIRKRPDVRGSETYVMGLHTADHNLNVAMRENASIALEQNFENGYDGYDPNSPESHIMLSMYQNAFLERSILFAELVENQIPINGEGKLTSRGVRQAGFLVLKATAMPSVLVESGYLSNEIDEELLMTGDGQKNIAFSIFKAFTAYRNIVEGDKSGELVKASYTEMTPENGNKEVQGFSNLNTAPNQNEGKDIPKPISINASDNNESASVKSQENEIEIQTYKIQLAATPVEVDLSEGIWTDIKERIEILKVNGLLKYVIDTGSNIAEAEKQLLSIRKNGFPEAFLSSYHGNQRVKILPY